MQLARIFSKVDRHQPLSSFLYVGLVLASAIALGVNADWERTRGDWPIILFFLALVTLAELLYVQLPQGKGRVSVSFAINLGAILTLSPHEAAFVAGVGIFIANIIRETAIDIALFNGGQLWITAGVSAYVWRLIWVHESLLPIPPGEAHILLLGVLAAAFTYYVLNILLVSVGIVLAYRLHMREVFTKNIFWGIPNYISLGILGFLIAVLYGQIGVYGVLLLWIPLLLARYSFQQYMDMRTAHIETIQALATALDARDPYTRGHSERVSEYAEEIARCMKLPVNEIETIRIAGILHDIGKIGISDLILNKVGKLTDEEFEIVKSHTTIGAQMVRPIGFLQGISLIIKHHHERYGGGGYPEGISGTDIPLGARIMAVADAFDAMTYDRVYRAGLEPDQAVEQLIQGRGTQFDPDVVDIFVNKVLPRKIALTRDSAPERLKEPRENVSDQLWQRTSNDVQERG